MCSLLCKALVKSKLLFLTSAWGQTMHEYQFKPVYKFFLRRRNTSFSTVTGPRTGQQTNTDSIPERGKRCLFSKVSRKAIGHTQLHIQWLYGLLPRRWNGQAVKQITHLHLVPKLRMCRAIPQIQPMPSHCAWNKFTFAVRSCFQILWGKTFANNAICFFLNINFSTIT